MVENLAEIGRATVEDLDGIMALLAENQPGRGGRLSAGLPRSLIAEIMRETPIIVSRLDGCVIGCLVTSTREMNADIPIIDAMLAAYSGSSGSHVYGPICVATEHRGKGVAQAMFAELRRWEPAREYILFTRRDNPIALRAHAKMGMCEVAGFVYQDNDYVVLSSLRSAA
ncbi:GNAT family N-acetyltransferase [Desulfoprunum benzoelyticum]|uniref:GNAT superfamily N-acetyltransferase n=1 Tax=Desulfoprunum benzoelyticum TaxID=1506996 RepID=A0A840V206_9BACT|nr:GNAT family N-acetyltransferase [Desulfoprunum benzoelyticum]MBB5349704.1 GNAT superfamily N-acetyltransferase [Desulfoprunum benzoelyticum]MBM9531753.1 GNAT family N-acetyltransferase [Desulfoprunum benzoelyticum]